MRGRLIGFCCSAVATVAAADPPAADPPAVPAGPPVVIGYGALPGGLVVPNADTLPQGSVVVGTLDAYGQRKGLLGPNEVLRRFSGDLAVAYAITDFISAALSFDGRADHHTGGDPSPDDGYVGNPHLIVRGSLPAAGTRIGAQLGVWVPGRNAPSIAGSAVSVDLRALVSLPAGPGTLSFEGGFRLDNSASSAADVASLSLADRTSLGVSDFNEAFGGASLAFPIGQAWIDAEASADAFLGSAPTTAGHAALLEGSVLLRGVLSGGYHITESWSALASVAIAKSPGILESQIAANAVPLVPYEPTFMVGIGVSARFGGPEHVTSTVKDCAHTAEGCPPVESPIVADISGTVVDEANKPIVGATIAIKLKNAAVDPTATDASGAYVFKGIRIGAATTASGNRPATRTIDETTAEIQVTVDGKQPGTASLAKIDEGANTVPAVQLRAVLPPGEIRGVVRSLPAGKPVPNAEITIEPGGLKVDVQADGTFKLALAPGTYTLSVKAPGFASQELPLAIVPQGVAIKDIELHR